MTASGEAGRWDLRASPWARRGLAVAVFVAAAAIVWRAMSLPAASAVEDATGWTIDAGDELTLIGPKPGQVLGFQGPVGKDVGLRFAGAALTDQTRQGLQALGVAIPQQAAPLQWVTHAGGGSRAMVDIRLQPAGPKPALVLQTTGGDGVAELAFSAQDARLTVAMSGAKVGEDSPPADVTIGGQAFRVRGGGAFPIEVEVPVGSSFTLRFAQVAADGAAFRWGVQPDPNRRLSVLELTGVRLRRPGETDRLYVCGAEPGAIAWRAMDVARLACRPTLRLFGLDLSRSSAGLTVTGTGYVSVKGKPEVFSWKAVHDNPLVGGLAGAVYSAFVLWTMRWLLGGGSAKAGPTPAAAPASVKGRRTPR